VGTLTFPYIGYGPERGRYFTENDLVGVSVNAMAITGGYEITAYEIVGNQIPLGEGGITVTPAIQATGWTETDINAPLLLSAPQTWTINGSSYVGWLNLHANVSGAANALHVKLNNGNLAVGTDIETGPISISGLGSVYLGAALGAYLIGGLNGNDGNPVSLGEAASLYDENTNKEVDKNAYDLGALTLAEGGLLQLGQLEYNAPVMLPVNGGLTFSPASQLSLLFNSQIHATGPVELGGASLSIGDGTTLINGSRACDITEVNTLISTTGTLGGTFGGIPDGAVIPVPCGLPVDALARINYTEHAVIATLLQRTTTELDVTDPTPTAGQTVTVKAAVTGERTGDGTAPGTVSFFNGGAPIAGCSAQPLSPYEQAAVASCELSFGAAGTREITAIYAGSPTFLASSSLKPRVIVVQPNSPGPHPSGGHGVSLLSKTILVKASGAASVKLDCQGQASCEGTLRLTVKRAKRSTTIATGHFSIATGKHTIEVKLNATGKRLLAGAGGRLNPTLLIDGSGGGGQRRVDLDLIGPRAGR